MGDLAAFLAARLDEDEAAARAAIGRLSGRWHIDGGGDIQDEDTGGGGNAFVAVGPWDGPVDEVYAAHIARHDPARVLREVEAGRVILAAYQAVLAECATMLHDRRPRKYGEHDGLRKAVCELAAVYRDNPDYDPAWAPG